MKTIKFTALFLLSGLSVFSLQAQLKVNSSGSVDILGSANLSNGLSVSGNTYLNSTLQVYSEYYPGLIVEHTGKNGPAMKLSVDYPGNNLFTGLIAGSSSPSIYVTSYGAVYAYGYYTTSDLNAKQNIATIESPLSKLLKLRGVTYQYKPVEDKNTLLSKEAMQLLNHEFSKRRMGVIAQEVEEVVPEVVVTKEDGSKAVSYSELVGLLIEAMKEQQQQIEELKSVLSPVKLRGDASIEETATNEAGSTLLSGCRLYQNTPNPFTQETEIRYQLTANTQEAYICIFDMQGSMLKKLNAMGQNHLSIKGAELKAGMYLYSLIADGREVDTKRMILTK